MLGFLNQPDVLPIVMQLKKKPVAVSAINYEGPLSCFLCFCCFLFMCIFELQFSAFSLFWSDNLLTEKVCTSGLTYCVLVCKYGTSV